MDTLGLGTLSELLDLEGFEVVHAESDRKTKVRQLTIVATATAAVCPHCHRATAKRHACHDRNVVDLPLGGWKTELVAQLFQFECTACDKFFTPRHRGLAEGAHATERFLERLGEYATHGDVSTAAGYLGVAEKTAEKWYYDYLKRRQLEPAKDLLPIDSLGIDEIALKKDSGNSSAC
jgi:transposase